MRSPRPIAPPFQKLAQLTDQGLAEMLDAVSVWCWLKPGLNALIGDMDKMTTMWSSGTARLTRNPSQKSSSAQPFQQNERSRLFLRKEVIRKNASEHGFERVSNED